MTPVFRLDSFLHLQQLGHLSSLSPLQSSAALSHDYMEVSHLLTFYGVDLGDRGSESFQHFFLRVFIFGFDSHRLIHLGRLLVAVFSQPGDIPSFLTALPVIPYRLVARADCTFSPPKHKCTF